MQFSDEELTKFSELYEEEFHEPLSLPGARYMATRLLDLCMILVKPLPIGGGSCGARPDEAEGPPKDS